MLLKCIGRTIDGIGKPFGSEFVNTWANETAAGEHIPLIGPTIIGSRAWTPHCLKRNRTETIELQNRDVAPDALGCTGASRAKTRAWHTRMRRNPSQWMLLKDILSSGLTHDRTQLSP